MDWKNIGCNCKNNTNSMIIKELDIFDSLRPSHFLDSRAYRIFIKCIIKLSRRVIGLKIGMDLLCVCVCVCVHASSEGSCETSRLHKLVFNCLCVEY